MNSPGANVSGPVPVHLRKQLIKHSGRRRAVQIDQLLAPAIVPEGIVVRGDRLPDPVGAGHHHRLARAGDRLFPILAPELDPERSAAKPDLAYRRAVADE